MVQEQHGYITKWNVCNTTKKKNSRDCFSFSFNIWYCSYFVHNVLCWMLENRFLQNNELISHTQYSLLFINGKKCSPFSSLPYQFNTLVFFLNGINKNDDNNDDKMILIFVIAIMYFSYRLAKNKNIIDGLAGIETHSWSFFVWRKLLLEIGCCSYDLDSLQLRHMLENFELIVEIRYNQ